MCLRSGGRHSFERLRQSVRQPERASLAVDEGNRHLCSKDRLPRSLDVLIDNEPCAPYSLKPAFHFQHVVDMGRPQKVAGEPPHHESAPSFELAVMHAEQPVHRARSTAIAQRRRVIPDG